MKINAQKIVFFAFSFIFMLFVVGCTPLSEHNKDVEFDTNVYTLIGDTYTRTIKNQVERTKICTGIQIPHDAKIGFYVDAEYQFSFLSKEDDMVEGDNYYYALITFKDGSTKKVKINIHRLQLFTVKFKTNCTQKIDDVVVEEDSLLEEPTVELKKQGYTFKGWKHNFKNAIKSDLTIEAKWSPNNYIVTFDPNGGEYYEESVVVTYDEDFEFTAPTREGYDFVGWKYNNRTYLTGKWLIDSDVTMVAEWEKSEVTYEIDYVIVGAVGPNLERTYSNKKSLVLRIPYKCGYKFVGWYYEGDFSGERIYEIPVGTEGNLRLYSKWEAFNIVGSKISILGDSISTFYGDNSELNSYWHEKDQYYFPIYSTTVKSYKQTWWGRFLENTKAVLECNESYSGSTVYNWGNETSNSPAMNKTRISHLGKPDIVIIFMGTNDVVNGFTDSKFENAYRTMLQRVKEQCEDAYIFCCTLGYSAYKKYYYTDEKRLSFNEIIRKACENVDGKVIELAEVQTQENYNEYLGDSLHPNDIGMEAYANRIIKEIREYTGNLEL